MLVPSTTAASTTCPAPERPASQQRRQQPGDEEHRAAAEVAHHVQRHLRRPAGPADRVQGAGDRDVVHVVPGAVRPAGRSGPSRSSGRRRAAGCGPSSPPARGPAARPRPAGSSRSGRRPARPGRARPRGRAGCLRSTATLRRPRLSRSCSGTPKPSAGPPGRSTRKTSAPRSARTIAANGAGPMPASSTTRRFCKGPGTWPSWHPAGPHTGGVPFTASHPAAVLPFVRRGHWVTAGLVSGSVAPDVPSFVPLGLSPRPDPPARARSCGRTACSPIGVLLAWWVLLRPGLAPLWPAAAARCGPSGWRAARGLAPAAAAHVAAAGWPAVRSCVGLATHLLWDSFTHADGFVVRRLGGAVRPMAAGTMSSTGCRRCPRWSAWPSSWLPGRAPGAAARHRPTPSNR